MTDMRSTARVAVLALLALVGCSKDVDGPKPMLAAPTSKASPPPVNPEIICRDQVTSKVTLHGSGFSPVPIDIPHAPKTALPSVILSRAHTLAGKSVGAPDEVRFKRRPGRRQDQHRRRQGRSAAALEGPGRAGVQRQPEDLDWRRQARGSPEGVYDVTVENPNGNRVTSPASLAVVARPELDALDPNLLCLAQSARSLAITGQGLLKLDGKTPAIEIDGMAQDIALDLSECDAIAHKGIDAELCKKADLMLDKGALDPDLYPIAIDNPETAACHTEEDVTLRVVPPPMIDSVQPSPVCVEDVDQKITVRGSDFLSVDDTDPTVMIDGKAFDVVAIDGCAALDTQGHTVQSCTAIDLGTIVADVGVGTHDVTVENPQPAGCSDAAKKALHVFPPPTVTGLANEEVCADSMQTVVILGKDFAEGAKVSAGSIAADSVMVVDDTRIEATFTAGLPPEPMTSSCRRV